MSTSSTALRARPREAASPTYAPASTQPSHPTATSPDDDKAKLQRLITECVSRAAVPDAFMQQLVLQGLVGGVGCRYILLGLDCVESPSSPPSPLSPVAATSRGLSLKLRPLPRLEVLVPPSTLRLTLAAASRAVQMGLYRRTNADAAIATLPIHAGFKYKPFTSAIAGGPTIRVNRVGSSPLYWEVAWPSGAGVAPPYADRALLFVTSLVEGAVDVGAVVEGHLVVFSSQEHRSHVIRVLDALS